MTPSPNVIVAGIIALVFLAVAAVVGSSFAKIEADRILYLITGLIAPTILAFLALLKADRTEQHTKNLADDVKTALNGKMDKETPTNG